MKKFLVARFLLGHSGRLSSDDSPRKHDTRQWHAGVLTILTLSLIACGAAPLPGDSGVVSSGSATSAAVGMETYPSGLRVAFNSGLRQGATRKLVWSDEFDGSALAPENWFAETGDGSQYGLVGWGNNELQWYQPDNARIVNGKLVINVRQQKRNGYDYTSARIITRDRFAFRYGRIEARIRLPEGQGLWSAFWLLPQDKVYGGWAASGEIDIMEAVNQQNQPGNKIHGTIHFGGPWPDNQHSGKSYRVAGNTVSKYHVYALEWDKTGMRWYVDGNLYSKTNAWSSSAAAYPAPFDQPFYILLNVAVGGELPGAPDASAELQADMAIDYVRIYSGD